ncbi:MAG: putative quinol monooxygenase [Pseudomonadota bacterium]
MPYAVTVVFDVAPDHRDTFVSHMLVNARASVRDEPGCLQFDVCTDPAHPGQVFLYEIYTDLAAFETHQTMPHFAAFGEAAGDLIAGKTVRTFDTVQQAHR